MNRIEQRLRKLESAALPPTRSVVVYGRDDAECNVQIEALKQAGKATDQDRFVCLTLFRDSPPREPVICGHPMIHEDWVACLS